MPNVNETLVTRTFVTLACALAFAAGFFPTSAIAATTLKIATVIPDGTDWMKTMREGIAEIEERTCTASERSRARFEKRHQILPRDRPVMSNAARGAAILEGLGLAPGRMIVEGASRNTVREAMRILEAQVPDVLVHAPVGRQLARLEELREQAAPDARRRALRNRMTGKTRDRRGRGAWQGRALRARLRVLRAGARHLPRWWGGPSR